MLIPLREADGRCGAKAANLGRLLRAGFNVPAGFVIGDGERLLAAELDGVGARAVVEEVYRDFLPLNDVVATACTAWQLAERVWFELHEDLIATLGLVR